jgi:hypothetical protein
MAKKVTTSKKAAAKKVIDRGKIMEAVKLLGPCRPGLTAEEVEARKLLAEAV